MSLVALLTRTMISLAIVLAVVAVAYQIAKRRAGGGSTRRTTAGGQRGVVGARSGGLFSGRRKSAPAPIEVVGRVGLTRGAAAVAVRFGDRVVLVSASDQGPATVLSEMSGTDWDEYAAPAETSTPISRAGADATRGVLVDTARRPLNDTTRPSFVEALRQATSRHA